MSRDSVLHQVTRSNYAQQTITHRAQRDRYLYGYLYHVSIANRPVESDSFIFTKNKIA